MFEFTQMEGDESEDGNIQCKDSEETGGEVAEPLERRRENEQEGEWGHRSRI